MGVTALTTRRDALADDIKVKLGDLCSLADKQAFCGMAVVLVKPDGGVFVSMMGQGNRVLMLGAVTDLQYTLAKDGDKE